MTPDPDIAAWRQFTMDLAAGKVDTGRMLAREAFVAGWNAGRAEAAQRALDDARAKVDALPEPPGSPDPYQTGWRRAISAVLATFGGNDGANDRGSTGHPRGRRDRDLAHSAPLTVPGRSRPLPAASPSTEPREQQE